MTLSECGGHAKAIGADAFALAQSGDGTTLCETALNSFSLLGSGSNPSLESDKLNTWVLSNRTTVLGTEECPRFAYFVYTVDVNLQCSNIKTCKIFAGNLQSNE